MHGECVFAGGATLYRDRTKLHLFAELFESDGSLSGKLRVLHDKEPLLAPGPAYVRFSNGYDAQVTLLASDGQQASFNVSKLGTLEPDMERWGGTRREASAQDPLSDWPKPAGS